MTAVVHSSSEPHPDGKPALSARGLVWEAPLVFVVEHDLVTCSACRPAVDEDLSWLATEHERGADAVLVFLDVDGVLNHASWLSRVANHPDLCSREGAWAGFFDPACVERANRTVDVTGALVVVSSSWREIRTVRVLQSLLNTHGFTGRLIGRTDGLPQASRAAEIRAWVDGCPRPPAAFVVLDDDSDMEGVRDHFVKTSFHRGGLTDEKADEAIRILKAAR
jgi:hypothetical protein